MKLGFLPALVSAALISTSAMAEKPTTPPGQQALTGIQVFSAGKPIGFLLELNRSMATPLTLLSSKGYVFGIYTAGATVRLAEPRPWDDSVAGTVYFAGSGCSGEAYIALTGNDVYWLPTQGLVFQAPAGAYYLPRNPRLVVGDYASYALWGPYSAYWECIDVPGSLGIDPAVVLPNNPDVTGVPNVVSYPLPIVVGVP